LLLQTFKCDHSARELLSSSLRMNEMANDGYLFFDESNGVLRKSPHRIDREETIAMQRTMNQTGFKFAMDKPLPEQHQGSLTGKLFHYRHQDLKVGQAIKVLESLLGSVETQMMSQPVF